MPLAFAFDGVTVLVLPVLLDRAVGADRQATVLGLLSFGGLLAAAVAQPVAGALSDTFRPTLGRRGLILAGTIPVMIGLGILALGRGVAAIVVGYVVLQVAAAAVQAAQQGFIPDLVPAAWRGRASGLKGLFDVGGSFLGFLVLGVVVAAGDVTAAFGIIAALFVVAVAATVFLVNERRHSTQSDLRDVTAGGEVALSNRVFVRLVASRFAFLVGIYVVGRFFVLLVETRLGLDAEQAAGRAGMILAALTLITAAAAVPGGWLADRGGRIPVMVCGAVLTTIGIAALAAANTDESLLLSGGFIGIGSGAFAAANWAMTTDVVPDAMAARFMGLANVGTGGAAAAAGLLGPIVDVAGRQTGFAVLLAIAALATAASVVPLRGIPDVRPLRLSPVRS
jgi:MFS family permease